MREPKSLEFTKRERKMHLGDFVQRNGKSGRIIGDGRFGDWLVRWSTGGETGCFEHDLTLDVIQSDL